MLFNKPEARKQGRTCSFSSPKRMYIPTKIHLLKQSGFTLIEIVIGMVALSITMAIFINMILPAEDDSVDQIYQIKAAELGQALLDEIQGRAYDHYSDHAGGVWRCNEAGRNDCTLQDYFGPEDGAGTPVRPDFDEDDRSDFNDVDDYHNYSSLITPTDGSFHAGYNGFGVSISVSYAGTALGLSANNLAKLITVSVTTPAPYSQQIDFSAYKSNF